MNAFEKLSYDDRYVIVQCMKLLLDGDWFFPGEEYTRMGVWEYELREVLQLLTQVLNTDNTSLLKTTMLSIDTIYLAIHNGLNEVSAGIDIDANTLRTYGLTRKVVDDTYDNWIKVSGMPGGIA